MKPNHKKLAKGAKAFKKKFPKGTIQKYKSPGRIKGYDPGEVNSLANLFLDPGKWLELLEKYEGANSPKHEKLAKEFFTSILKSEAFDNPFKLKNLRLSHPLLDNDGHWSGEDYQLLSFLCQTNRFNSQEIKKILEAMGIQYTKRAIQMERKKW